MIRGQVIPFPVPRVATGPWYSRNFDPSDPHNPSLVVYETISDEYIGADTAEALVGALLRDHGYNSIDALPGTLYAARAISLIARAVEYLSFGPGGLDPEKPQRVQRVQLVTRIRDLDALDFVPEGEEPPRIAEGEAARVLRTIPPVAVAGPAIEVSADTDGEYLEGLVVLGAIEWVELAQEG